MRNARSTDASLAIGGPRYCIVGNLVAAAASPQTFILFKPIFVKFYHFISAFLLRLGIIALELIAKI
jgi:hypothetical protein